MRLLFLSFFVILLAVVLIRAIPVSVDDEDNDEADFDSSTEMMMPRRSSYRNITHPVFASIEKINERIADYLYQSDILLTLEQVDDLLSQNTLNTDENDEDSDSSSSEEFETLEADTDVIHFLNGAGCFSSIGRVGGSQQLSVADGCEHLGFGILSHEIGHALGFWHEQARSDRDRFVKAPINKAVEVRVRENSAQCNFGCTLNALQIKTSINYKMTGMRVCCRDDNRNYIYQSEGNLMPILAEAYYRFSFKLQYRISPEDNEKSRDEMSTTEPANEPYQENECQAAGGVCKYSDDCNSGITDAMLCPKQSKSIHCCLAPSVTTTAARPKATGWNVFQEKECRAADGICQSSTRPCRGTSRGIFCPRQADATCCIPPFQEALCEAALGQCKHTSECRASLSVSALCPTQSDDVKCCIAYQPHQEIQCAAVGGKCTIAAPSACPRGRLLPSLCPMQPAGVACCAPRRPFQEQACQNAGGVC
uniref:Metalloendopeptidase n=1 Tax=Plectus sambesii TaxID=2011161 RepID=A0A914XFM4_9BILA